MTSASPDWEISANTGGFLLQRCKTQLFVRQTDIPMRRSIRDLNVAFKIPYLHDFIAKRRRQYSEVIQNHKQGHFRNVEHNIYVSKRLKFSGDQSYVKICFTNPGLIEALHLLYAHI